MSVGSRQAYTRTGPFHVINEKFAAKLTVVYAYYVSGNPIPLEDEKVRVVIKP
jgi:FlaG/FlaF family flagellin (archaellin)